MSVVEAITRDLDALRPRAPELADSALAAAALALALELDEPGNSATSKSMCARTLMDLMGQLTTLAPAVEIGDGVDDLAARRVARLAGGLA